MPDREISNFDRAQNITLNDILLGVQEDATKSFSWGVLFQYIKDNLIPKSFGDYAPVGSVFYFAGATPPPSFLVCNGSSVSRSTYAELFAIIGTTYGSVDASHFNLPDLRGEFIRGWDNGRNVDASRNFGSSQNYGTAVNGKLNLVTVSPFQPLLNPDKMLIPQFLEGTYLNNRAPVTASISFGGTDSETRPRNVALLPIIKAERLATEAPETWNFIPLPSNPSSGQYLQYDNSGIWTGTTITSPTPGGIQLGSSKTALGLSAVEFINIPSNANQITLMFNSISTTLGSDVSIPLIQLGTVTDFKMSEYNGSVTGFSTQVSTSSLSNGVALRDSGWNTDTTSGIYTFNKFSDNIWMFSGRNNKGFASGSVSLDSSLTRIRLFTSSIFNNGSVNVSYELSN